MVLQKTTREERRGLVIVFTGNGKGKTTAAIGMAVRATGYKWHILMVQFIKGDWDYGELEGYKKLYPNFDLKRMGKGFVGIMGDKLPFEEHVKAAQNALKFVSENLNSNYDIIILDEVNVAIKEGLLPVEEVVNLIKNKPAYLHLVLTGRDGHPQLIELADLVTEMKEIKHPFQQGILAQPGIDY
jgi:cob(I)alamin adenosyltransferase